MATRRFNTTDGYSDANSVSVQSPVKQITIVVLNAGATARFAVADRDLRAGAYSYGFEEKPMIPGVWKWTADDFNGFPLTAVQLRSTVAGASADVTVHA